MLYCVLELQIYLYCNLFLCLQLWITEKSSLLLSVEEVTNMKDLATVMILQRRLNSIQRDLGPLEDKVGKLLSETRLLLDIVFTIFFSSQVTKLENDSEVLCSEYQGVSIKKTIFSSISFLPSALMRSALFLFLLTIFCSFRLFFTFE